MRVQRSVIALYENSVVFIQFNAYIALVNYKVLSVTKLSKFDETHK
mgnify:CR=1 FL=1